MTSLSQSSFSFLLQGFLDKAIKSKIVAALKTSDNTNTRRFLLERVDHLERKRSPSSPVFSVTSKIVNRLQYVSKESNAESIAIVVLFNMIYYFVDFASLYKRFGILHDAGSFRQVLLPGFYDRTISHPIYFLNIFPNVRFFERSTIFYLLFFKNASMLWHYSIFIALFTLLHFFNKP